MEGVVAEVILLFALLVIAAMYSSVGHGGASDICCFISTYAANDPVWLKQHAWSMNLLVAELFSPTKIRF